MVLDGAASIDDPDDLGMKVFSNEQAVVGDETTIKLKIIGGSFGLLLREGLEAILVVVAIIAYLVKTGNQKLCKQVYIGMAFGVICSFLLAFLIDWLLGGVGQELMEGITSVPSWLLFLFWVSKLDIISFRRTRLGQDI